MQRGVQAVARFRAAISSTIRSLDPAYAVDSASRLISRQLFDGLIQISPDMTIQPNVAQSWQVDGDRLTFILKSGVKFRDDPCFPARKGREVTAQDFKYSFTRICDPTVNSNGRWIFQDKVLGANEYHHGIASEVEGFRVIRHDVFQIRMLRPYSPLLSLLALPYGWVVPKEAVEYYSNSFGRHPVGTGPFCIKAWDEKAIVLEKNPDYFEIDSEGNTLPYIEEAIVLQLPDEGEEIRQFLNGSLDASVVPDCAYGSIVERDTIEGPRLIRELEGRGIVLERTNLLDTTFYGFKMDSPLFANNKLLRQAMNFGIDRDYIVNTVYNGRGVAAKSIIPPGLIGSNSSIRGYSYDSERANELLAQAGFPFGRGLPPITLDINQGRFNEDMASAVSEMLGRIGVHIRVVKRTWSEHIARLEKGESEFFRGAWIADYPDAENFLMLFYSNNWPPGPNWTKFKNDRFDSLYSALLRAGSLHERMELIKEGEMLVIDEAPWLVLTHGIMERVKQPWVLGYDANPMDIGYLKYVKVQKTV